MKRATQLVVLAALGIAASSCRAAVWYVAKTGSDGSAGTSGAPFATIQHAINTAAAGDTIMVSAGTYGESLDWEKDLTIQGAGQGLSIIDPTAGSIGRCVLTRGLTSASRLVGFTLQHGRGFGSEGGGVYIWQGSPTISGCTFAYDLADATGAGIFCYQSSPTIVNCMFVGNSSQAVGGGICSLVSNITVTNCTFTGNSATGGGAIATANGSVTVTNCTFAGNYAGGSGGAMDNYLNSPTISNCTFTGNSAGFQGGVMYNEASSPAITNCILWGNSAPNSPGIINVNNDYLGIASNPTITYTNSQDLSNSTPDANHNFAADPLFVRNPTVVLAGFGTVNVSSSDFGDLRLRPASPCIDTGNTGVVLAPPFPTNSAGTIIDLVGNPRIVDGDGDGTATVDMGAYEFQPVVLQALSKVQALIDQVKTLVDGGAILPANGQPLYAKLDAAIGYLQAGDFVDAKAVLKAFINQVTSFVNTGRLTSAQGSALVTEAQAIITLLGG